MSVLESQLHPRSADFQANAAAMHALVEDLMEVDRVDRDLAISIKDTLERVTESTILDQYS